MKPALHERILATIERHAMLRPGERVGIGVSGGADSVALLFQLVELRDVLGIRPLVLHFNHQLRGAESDADERFVAALASAQGLECMVASEDVAAAARRNRWNLEDAARRLRYDFFNQVVDSGRATRVAVAHTADDQAETVLAHLIRGTGLAGLAAIYPVAGLVVRPLLEIRRQELREYLTSIQQTWREDETNRDTSRLRARIRHGLLPQLESDYPPGVVTHLCQLATLAREDEVFWSAFLDDRTRALVERAGENLSVRISDLLSPLPLSAASASAAPCTGGLAAFTSRLIRRMIEEVKGDRRQLTAGHIEQVVCLATDSSSGHRIHLPAGVVVEKCFDRLVFSLHRQIRTQANRATDSKEIPYHYVVEIPREGTATVSIPEIGRRLCLKVIDWPPTASDTKMEAQALDRDLLLSPLVLRNWRPGDSYRPQGRRRVRKLKRLLLESRVAAGERPRWPVLTSNGLLVWARGLPVAQEFAAQDITRAGLVIREELL